MQKRVLDEVIDDLLNLPPMIRRLSQRKLVKAAFAKIETDINQGQLEIMKTLQSNGTMHIAEIGEKLQIPKPQMTHLIDGMERMGIAKRIPDQHDRRTTNVVLTDTGREISDDLDRVLYDGLAEKLSTLSEKEMKDLSIAFRKLMEIMSKL